jgi:hypothetical protein
LWAPGLIRELRISPPAPQAVASAEKLMRFCEIRRVDLHGLAKKKWPQRSARRIGLWAVASVLGEAALATGDLRYANTAKKLCDREADVGQRAGQTELLLRSHARRH